MPRYRIRKKEKRTVSKKFQGSEDIRDWALFAARLKPEELKSLQELARHYKGEKTRYQGKIGELEHKVLGGA